MYKKQLIKTVKHFIICMDTGVLFPIQPAIVFGHSSVILRNMRKHILSLFCSIGRPNVNICKQTGLVLRFSAYL